MRIAHILWSLGTGGTENMVVDIANVQAETEDVAIFVINDTVEQYITDRISPKCRLFLFNRREGSKDYKALFMFNLKLFLYSPNIIHVHARKLLRCIKVCKKVPRFRTLHGLIYHPEELSGFDKIISISEAVRQHTLKKGYESVVVMNGIKVSEINSEKTVPFGDGRMHVVQVGRLHSKTKGQDIAIEAMGILKSKGINNVVLHFIGDGPSRGELEKQVSRLGVDDMVIFEGRKDQKEIYQTLANYDLLIQPSREEGFGLTIAEAMAAKVPVLVSDIAAPMEVINHGKLGMYFQRGDSEDLAKWIQKCLLVGFNTELVLLAYQYVKNHYDVFVTANKYLRKYIDVINVTL